MLKVFDNEYEENLSWSKGYVRYGKGRIKLASLLLFSMLSSSIVMIVLSMGTWLYLFPIFITLQLIISTYNILTFRSKYLKRDDVRQIGFTADGSFEGSDQEKEVYLFVLELSNKLKLKTPPRVVIQYTNEMNAYAIGSSRNKGLIIITSATMQHMSMKTILSTVAHEMAHIVNGDCVGQMIVNNMAYAAALLIGIPIKIVSWPIAETIERWLGIDYISYVIQFIFGILTDYVLLSITKVFVLAYSRRREFRADLLEAKIMGRDIAIAALQEWRAVSNPRAKVENATMAFVGNLRRFDIFSTHPNWNRRIKYIERKLKNYDSNLMK
jgi:heat shock protein HtpX